MRKGPHLKDHVCVMLGGKTVIPLLTVRNDQAMDDSRAEKVNPSRFETLLGMAIWRETPFTVKNWPHAYIQYGI